MNEDEFAINERKIDKLDVGESRKLDLRVKNYIAYQLTEANGLREDMNQKLEQIIDQLDNIGRNIWEKKK